MGLDMIDKEFSPDMNSMEIIDKDELDRKKALAIESYNDYFDREKTAKDLDSVVEDEVKEVLEYVARQNKGDLKRLSEDVLGEAFKITKDQQQKA